MRRREYITTHGDTKVDYRVMHLQGYNYSPPQKKRFVNEMWVSS